MAKITFKVWGAKRGWRLKTWLIKLFIFLLASFFMINSVIIVQFETMSVRTTADQAINEGAKAHKEAEQSGYVVNTKGCKIRDISPFEPSSMKFFNKTKPVVCEHGTRLPLIESNNSAIFVNPEARDLYYYDNESIDCCWQSIYRSDNDDNNVTGATFCYTFQEAALIDDEFIRVDCLRHNTSVYVDYFAFVPLKAHVEKRCRRYKRELRARQRQLSVLVVGVDTLSRLNFRRLMPRTSSVLKELGAVEMMGYHKVADNTFPNVVPILTGLSEAELEKSCWRNHSNPFDECPFLWKKFRAKGYRTIFGEDACFMGTFNLLKPGFRAQPTDYYLRPFCLAAESEIGNTLTPDAHLCLGTRLNYAVLLRYARNVAEEFANVPYFGFFWQSSLTHDHIEYPQLGDDEYHDFFEYLDKYDLMRNAALVLVSDHGKRSGAFRRTYQGRFEDSLPTMLLAMPDWWKKQFPQAWEQIQANSRRLTTPFDLHETLLDVLDPSRLVREKESNDIPSLARRSSDYPRGTSMFRAIPEDRDCQSAGIPEHWCMCHSRRDVSRDDPILGRIVDFLVRQINAMLEKHRQCARLEFRSLVHAKAVSMGVRDPDDEKKPWTDYTATIDTSPGNAIFEGSIRDNGSFSLVGSISRLNDYGKQSACVDDFHLRLYCYCL